MKLFRICLTVAALSLCIEAAAYARLVNTVSYQELFDKSDLVVIAVPVTKTADTGERTSFQNMSQVDPDGKQTVVAAVGVETAFSVSLVMKGDRTIKQITLHHYRQADRPSVAPDGREIVYLSGPNVVSFDPSDARGRRNVLLFVVKEQDGRYAPYGGQTDPGLQAVTAMEGLVTPR